MLFNLKDVQGYRLQALDGTFGEIKYFLIDTFHWSVRYVVVQVGSRQVLLPIRSVAIVDALSKALLVNLSSEKIMNSPEIPLDRPFLRAREQELFDYYEWPYYWDAADVPSTMPGDLTAVPLINMELEREAAEDEMIPQTGQQEDQHLYHSDVLFNATVHATNNDQNAGLLSDLIVRDADWEVLYAAIETGTPLARRKVVLAPTWIEQIDAADGRVDVNLTSDTIEGSPEFKDVMDINEDYQARLNDYYREK